MLQRGRWGVKEIVRRTSCARSLQHMRLSSYAALGSEAVERTPNAAAVTIEKDYAFEEARSCCAFKLALSRGNQADSRLRAHEFARPPVSSGKRNRRSSSEWSPAEWTNGLGSRCPEEV